MYLPSAFAERLLTEQNECTLAWVCDDGTPAATIVSFFWSDEKIWMVVEADSPRLRSIQKRPDVAVVVTGKGTSMGIARCVSLRGQCVRIDEPQQRDWFFRVFSQVVLPDSSKGAAFMEQSMNNPAQVVLAMTPTSAREYDAHEMMVSANRY